MSLSGTARFPAQWLELRESADAAARAAGLLDPLRGYLAGAPRPGGRVVVRDLGCGTGSMARWLPAQLPGPQHWIMHDRDPDLLAQAAARTGGAAADGSPVTAATQRRDVTDLRAADLAGTSLVTASALLDLLTGAEVDELAAACVGAGCPALLSLSVVGDVELTPADPLDGELADAFNAHQRRVVGERRLLGPDAVDAAADAYARRGAVVRTHPSPWRLGADQSALMAEWLRGWVGAACEQRPALAAAAAAYRHRRLAACEAGELRVVVQHRDLLALPRAAGDPAGGGSR